MFLADLEQRLGSQGHAFHLGSILAIGEIQLGEVALVGEIAGIHTHLVHKRRHRLSHLGVEMHIRDEWNVTVTVCLQLFLDLLQRFYLLEGGHGETHHLRTRFNHPFALRDGSRHIRRIAVRHRLHHHGGIAADGHVAYLELSFTVHRVSSFIHRIFSIPFQGCVLSALPWATELLPLTGLLKELCFILLPRPSGTRS